MHGTTTIWLHPGASCGSDRGAHGGAAACIERTHGEPCPTPELRGAPAQLRHALERLNRVVESTSGRGLVDLQWIRSLRIDAGEAELTVTFGAHCAPGRLLSDTAFHALCEVLPDTDIYVRHAA